jgi:hypothetical protein
MKKDNKQAFLLNAPKYQTVDGRPKLLRVRFSLENTKIDFGYQTDSYYTKGGWVHIGSETYIRFLGNEKKYAMLDAINIPFAPNHLHFNTTKDWLYFSLIFEPIQVKQAKFDLIEVENGAETDFNYYNILLDEKKLIPIF